MTHVLAIACPKRVNKDSLLEPGPKVPTDYKEDRCNYDWRHGHPHGGTNAQQIDSEVHRVPRERIWAGCTELVTHVHLGKKPPGPQRAK